MSTPTDLYNQDFYTWAMTTAELMRQKQRHEIDWEAVIEEIEGLARRDKRELASRLETLVLEDSPSLRRDVDTLLSKRYRKARERALDQTGLPEDVLPPTCPWSSAQILADDFWPETW
jgi:hypothetical protein